MKIKLNKYAQIGLMVFLALATFIWGYNFLKGRNILKPSNDYFITFHDIAGAMDSDPVLIRGLKVGQVNEIKFDNKNPELIVLRIVIDKNIRLPKDSEVMLASTNMLGSKGIKLKIGKSQELYSAGDTIAGIIEPDMLSKLGDDYGGMKGSGESILSNTESITHKVDATLNEETLRNIQNIAANLSVVSDELAKFMQMNSQSLSGILENLEQTTEMIANERQTLATMLENLKTFSDDLSKVELSETMVHIDSTMANLAALTHTLNSDEGSLQKLMNDTSLYHNLNDAALNASLLMEDVREYPNRYVHISLVNRSKASYMNQDGVTKRLADNDNLAFLVLIKKSTKSIDINENNFVQHTNVSEFKYKGDYYYYIGEYKIYQNALDQLTKSKVMYPTASIQVLEKGKPVPMSKVLK